MGYLLNKAKLLKENYLYYPLILILLWHVIVRFFAILADYKLPDSAVNQIAQAPEGIIRILTPFIKWDAVWYYGIATQGYKVDDWVVFFPFFPLITHIFSLLTNINVALSGLFINFIALTLAVLLLFKLVLMDFDKDTALKSVWYLLIYPGAFYLVAFYTESLFLLFSIGTFYFARKKQFFYASLMALLAATTRVTGIILIIPLLFEYFSFNKDIFKNLRFQLLYFLIPLLGVISYMFYLTKIRSNPLAFIEYQQHWGRVPLWQQSDINIYHYLQSANFWIFCSFFIMSFFIYKKIRRSYGVYMGMYLVPIALSGSFESSLRYMLLLFPAFIYLATIKNIFAERLITLISILLLAIVMVLYVNGYWIS